MDRARLDASSEGTAAVPTVLDSWVSAGWDSCCTYIMNNKQFLVLYRTQSRAEEVWKEAQKWDLQAA